MFVIDSGPVYIYSLNEILESPTEKSIFPYSKTLNKFYSWYENSLVIVNDGQAIIGIEIENRKHLIFETLNGNQIQCFGQREANITTLLFHEYSNTLFVGRYENMIIGYKQNKNTNLWEEVQVFPNLGVEWVLCSAQLGSLILLAGTKRSFQFIDVKSGVISGHIIKTAFENIQSLQVCIGLDSNVFLSVGGENQIDYNETSDFFDISILGLMFQATCKEYSQKIKKIDQFVGQIDEKDKKIKAQRKLINTIKAHLSNDKNKHLENREFIKNLILKIKTRTIRLDQLKVQKKKLTFDYYKVFADFDLMRHSKVKPRSIKRNLLFHKNVEDEIIEKDSNRN